MNSCRKERLFGEPFEFNQKMLDAGSVIPIKSTFMYGDGNGQQNSSGHVSIWDSTHGEGGIMQGIGINFRTNAVDGVFVEDIGGIYGRLIASTILQDEYRKDAIICNTVGLIRQDNRTVDKHGYSNNEEEKECKPTLDMLPSEEEWMAILKRAQDGIKRS
jgi:hypothetical protein